MLDENLVHQIICLLNLDDLIKIRRCSQQVYDATERIFIEKDCNEPIDCKEYSKKTKQINKPPGNVPIEHNITIKDDDFDWIQLPPNCHTLNVNWRIEKKTLENQEKLTTLLENVPNVTIDLSMRKKVKYALSCIHFRNCRSLNFNDFVPLTEVQYLCDIKEIKFDHPKFRIDQFLGGKTPKWSKIHISKINSQKELDLINDCNEIIIDYWCNNFSAPDVSKLTATPRLKIQFLESFNGHIWQNKCLALNSHKSFTLITPDTVLKNVGEIELIGSMVTQTEPIVCTVLKIEECQLFCTRLAVNTLYYKFEYDEHVHDGREGIVYSPVDIYVQNMICNSYNYRFTPINTRINGIKKLVWRNSIYIGDFSFVNESGPPQKEKISIEGTISKIEII